jgi:hypothetical protein
MGIVECSWYLHRTFYLFTQFCCFLQQTKMAGLLQDGRWFAKPCSVESVTGSLAILQKIICQISFKLSLLQHVEIRYSQRLALFTQTALGLCGLTCNWKSGSFESAMISRLQWTSC